MLGCKNLASGGLEAFLRSVVIFVKYREVSNRTILPISSAIAEIALYLRFGKGMGKREKEEV